MPQKNNLQVRATLTYIRLPVFMGVYDTRRNHRPIGEQFSRIWGCVCKAKFSNQSSYPKEFLTQSPKKIAALR